jgi:hypothetical protein
VAELKAALDAIDGSPIKSMIDTHWHFDHADNNGNFRQAGRRRHRAREHEDAADAVRTTCSACTSIRARRRAADPDVRRRPDAERQRRTARLSHVPPGHTDTDIFVHFPKANVLHMVDVFFNGFYPFLDAGTGGNIDGMVAGRKRVSRSRTRRRRIVPGHGPLGDRASLDAYRLMLTTIVTPCGQAKKGRQDARRSASGQAVGGVRCRVGQGHAAAGRFRGTRLQHAPLSAMTTLQAVRRFLLGILLLGMGGTAVELLLLSTTRERSSSCRSCCWASDWRRSRGMRSSPAAPAPGRSGRRWPRSCRGRRRLYFHYRANVEFQLERSVRRGPRAAHEGARGQGPPALAPGVMIQLGLIGLAYTYRSKEQ